MKKLLMKIFGIKEISLSIDEPQYNTQYMFLQADQVRHTYLFLCNRYIKSMKEGNLEAQKILEKLIRDYVLIGEGQEFKDFKDILNIK